MKDMLNFLVSTVAGIYTDVITTKSDVSKPHVRESLFRRLVAIVIASYAMLHKLGYSNQDVADAIKEAQERGKDGQ